MGGGRVAGWRGWGGACRSIFIRARSETSFNANKRKRRTDDGYVEEEFVANDTFPELVGILKAVDVRIFDEGFVVARDGCKEEDDVGRFEEGCPCHAL